jgi:hypothetical protein
MTTSAIIVQATSLLVPSSNKFLSIGHPSRQKEQSNVVTTGSRGTARKPQRPGVNW